MRIRLLWLAMLATLLVTSACTTNNEDETGSEEEPGASSTTAESESGESPSDDDATVDPSVRLAIEELGGRLAITRGNQVWVSAPGGGGQTFIDGGDIVVAGQPVWSDDGTQLAWSSVDSQRQNIAIGDGTAPESRVLVELPGPPAFYLQWDAGGEQVVYLRNAEGGIEAGTASVEEGAGALGVGAPFYVAWSPDDSGLLAHVNGGELRRYENAGDGETLFRPTGDFTAADWIGPSTVVFATELALATLDLDTGVETALLDLDGPIRFVLSPDGRRLAFVAALASDPSPDPALRVLDIESGDIEVVTDGVALAWEWDRSGQRLAYLGIDGQSGISQVQTGDDDDRFRWFFWEGGETINAAPPFTPSQLMAAAYLPFFEQYAQSHHGWSPNGDGFAFAGSIGDDSGIWVQLVDQQVGPLLIAEGDAVTWSIAGDGGGASAGIT